jgi:hypothetical protein
MDFTRDQQRRDFLIGPARHKLDGAFEPCSQKGLKMTQEFEIVGKENGSEPELKGPDFSGGMSRETQHRQAANSSFEKFPPIRFAMGWHECLPSFSRRSNLSIITDRCEMYQER